ncbi:hypothetical protein AB0J82_39895 [Asanoa sp. NPDC049518]|uniref:hypothetical protein n=1 Tax=unclassified Asanoa TaxID=2685164 RepID=UPI00343AD39B
MLLSTSAAGCFRGFGCVPGAPDDITVSDLAGVYTGDHGARIELAKDGRYSASDLPERSGYAGEGTWTLDVDSETTEDMRLGDLQLWISGDRDAPWLYTFDGDPDNCDLVEFRRAG